MPNELVVVWRVTEQCNLGCPFCSYDHTLKRSRQNANVQDVRAFGRLLRDYQQKYRRTILISWLGGEPWLWQPLGELSHMFKQEFGLHIAGTTNGQALRMPHVRQQIIDTFDHLVVSVDGLSEFHDRVRNAPGAFQRLRANIISLGESKNAQHSNLTVGANTILMHANVRDFGLLCNELATWGVQEITFNILGGRDRPEFFPSNRLTPEDVAWFRSELPQLRRQLFQRGASIRGGEAYLDRLALLARNELCPVQDCDPGSRFWFIDQNGIIAPCNFTLKGYGVSMDQLREADDLHRLSTIFCARQKSEMLAPCYDCRSTQVFGKFDSGVVNGP